MSKTIFVVGGVISGGGKGLSAAALGYLLSLRGQTVQPIKFDPYYNTNAGVLAPREHGEVFLCDDGSETDLDLGHYERIIGCKVSSLNIMTYGTLLEELLREEKEGRFLGQTVQVNPHVIDKVHSRLNTLAKDADIVIAEIGGTVGDAESDGFMQAVRVYKQKHGDDVLVIMVAPILWFETIKEFKTKPLQQSVQTLMRYGVQPDILLCRTSRKGMPGKILDKVANLTGVAREAVFEAPDVDSIYQVPIEFYDRNIDDLIADRFRLPRNGCKIGKYREAVECYIKNPDLPAVDIAIVGKYDNASEAYLSLKEALFHAAVANNVRVNIRWVPAETVDQAKDMRGVWKHFENVHGVIVPGGFDSRGVEGKIRSVKYVREKRIPFLGICLGLQCAVIEIARNLCSIPQANSIEFDPEVSHPVIHYVEGQEHVRLKSSTMRLGAYDCEIMKDSLAWEIYKKKTVSERHRHRFEVNQEYIETLKRAGFLVSGVNPDTGLVEIMELDRSIHPFFVGTQAHPEFKSRLGAPAPLFNALLAAAVQRKNEV